MLDSIPLPLQAIFWPLAGAAITLSAGRWLPGWLRRVVATAAILAALAALWSLGTVGTERVEIPWEPLSFFRTGPTLYPDRLSLLSGLTLCGAIAASVLGIRGSQPQKTSWHGLLLVALAGSLITTTAANLPTLALGSGLIDLALIAMAVTAWNDTDRTKPPLDLAMMGILSTLVLLFGALQMSTQLGTTSLLAREIPEDVLVILGVAGVLRLAVFPLHSRSLSTPENVITAVLSIGTGIYLLARTQSIAPILADQPWMLFAGGAALLAGSLLTWAGGASPTDASSPDQEERPPGDSEKPRPKRTQSSYRMFWSGLTIHQTGLALAFTILLDGSVAWPWLGLASALTVLAIWWDGSLTKRPTTWPGWFQWLEQRIKPWWARIRASVTDQIHLLGRWREGWLARRGSAFLPTVALLSLIGMPFTAGVLGRWPFYAVLLDKGEAVLLLVVLAADIFFAAGLWTALGTIWTQSDEQRVKPTAFLAMLALSVSVIVLGIAPGILTDNLGLDPSDPPSVSVWGLGLIYVLPWLLGAWLARLGTQIRRYLHLVGDVIGLDWFYRAAAWIGQRLVSAVHWIGRAGEGEGWWGWALIVMALVAILLTAR